MAGVGVFDYSAQGQLPGSRFLGLEREIRQKSAGLRTHTPGRG
jgi:hypothetical protein